jgi:hypothetical protein
MLRMSEASLAVIDMRELVEPVTFDVEYLPCHGPVPARSHSRANCAIDCVPVFFIT